ncbi:hypothetical protein CHS0354_015972 [Potamilus streckersoni]|uniref:non-specific serine/threonine protein kinase n=1 Tax=Potamilus streckersoni TaxID=2493646 RepID=A0AAE0SIP9_9BIVA|nr:hypothetical protein CHS0354_015972 [Potamilus streckersoni]
MIELGVLVSVAILGCGVLLVFGCVCHLFKKRHGFLGFEDYDPESARGVSVSSENATGDGIVFEPLPDILAKTVGTRALRPRITSADKEKQANASKLVTVYQHFPRSQLLYVKELGVGWFGQVLEGHADKIMPDSRRSKVVIKILKDDATEIEQRLFLEEVAPYREFNHPNIVRLLGQCTEASPFLAVLEYPSLGDLKTYLRKEKLFRDTLIENGTIFKFSLYAAEGFAFMHGANYIHHDFAARNCIVTSELSVKIGDYGIAEDMHRDDYYDTGRDLLPVRWMSPESLTVKQNVWTAAPITKEANVWSFGVTLWEILEFSQKPFHYLKDEEVLQRVLSAHQDRLPPPATAIPLKDRWYELMEMCWQKADQRPTADDIVSFLKQILKDSEKITKMTEFEKKWNHLPSNQPNNDDQSDFPNSQSQVFELDFISKETIPKENSHVTEVIVHRTDSDSSLEMSKLGTETDNVPEVYFAGSKINRDKMKDSLEIKTMDFSAFQNDSVLAYGGTPTNMEDFANVERYKELFSPDANILPSGTSLVPIVMSTPSKDKDVLSSRKDKSSTYLTATSNQQSSQYFTAYDTITQDSEDLTRSENSLKPSKSYRARETSDSYQNGDEDYTTEFNNNSDKEDSETPRRQPNPTLISHSDDGDYEIAKEIYRSKGTALLGTSLRTHRSLSTIPEDGIPSDTTSQSGLNVEDPFDFSAIPGFGTPSFEWDDYIGEELIGRVKYSDESPRQVEEFNEWTFDNESNHSSESASQKQDDSSSTTSDNHPGSVSDVSAPPSESEDDPDQDVQKPEANEELTSQPMSKAVTMETKMADSCTGLLKSKEANPATRLMKTKMADYGTTMSEGTHNLD